MIRCYVGIMAVAMTLFPLAANAGRGMDRATGQAIWDAAVNGKTTTLGIGQGAMRVIKPTTTGTPVRASGGGASVTDTMPLPVGGVNVPVSATTNVSKTDIAGAVVGCATGGVVGCALSAIPLAVAWMSLSGARVNPQTGGLETTDLKACTVGPCFEYKGPYTSGDVYRRDPDSACALTVTGANVGVPASTQFYLVSVVSTGSNNYDCKAARNGFAGETYTWSLSKRSAPPLSPTWYSSTPQEVKDALYKNDPPPAIIDELSKYGNIIWPGPASVTGPSSITGPKTTSVTTSGNQSSTTVSQASTPLTYQGASVTAGNPTTTSTTTTTTTNPDGSTSTNTSSTTTTTEQGSAPEPETPAEEGTPSDTALPPVPDLYTRKYPNGMEGIWSDYKDQLKAPTLYPSSASSCPTSAMAAHAPHGPSISTSHSGRHTVPMT